MAGGVGLDALLPVDSSALWYPLNMLHPDPLTRRMKKLDRQRLLTIGYYNLYRHSLRYFLIFIMVLLKNPVCVFAYILFQICKLCEKINILLHRTR